jgi:4,5-DOPA dioxygenase extradiol
MTYHFELAKKLNFLREEGVLIIGSGNIVHNLGIIDYEINAPVMKWAKILDETIKNNILTKNYEDLLNFQNMGELSTLGIPTWDHYLPLLYVLALQEDDEDVRFIHEGFQHGSISMRCFGIGL